MMLRFLRIMAMWLLALAVPVQGFAAASMIGCGTAHHGAAGLHSATGHQHHASDIHHGDDHKAHGGAKVSKASCSACASCCTSAALPTGIMVFEPTDGPEAFVALAPHPVATLVSGGPRRPPRSILA